MISDPLTGRDSELGVIRRALGGVGYHSGVVIAGAAGVGKTWLAREALRRAEASGERTQWIVGTESAHALPLGAFIGLLGQAMSDPLTNVRRVINSFVAQQHRCRAMVRVDDAHLQKPAMPCCQPKWLVPPVGCCAAARGIWPRHATSWLGAAAGSRGR